MCFYGEVGRYGVRWGGRRCGVRWEEDMRGACGVQLDDVYVR